MAAAAQPPFSMADLIEASRLRCEARGGAPPDGGQQGDEGAGEMRPYRAVAEGLLAPLFGALLALESLRIDSGAGAAAGGGQRRDDLSSSDISLEANDPGGPEPSWAGGSGPATPTGRAAAGRTADGSPRTPTPRNAYGAAVQRAVFQNDMALAVDLVTGSLREIQQYDLRLQFLGKLVRAPGPPPPGPVVPDRAPSTACAADAARPSARYRAPPAGPRSAARSAGG